MISTAQLSSVKIDREKVAIVPAYICSTKQCSPGSTVLTGPQGLKRSLKQAQTLARATLTCFAARFSERLSAAPCICVACMSSPCSKRWAHEGYPHSTPGPVAPCRDTTQQQGVLSPILPFGKSKWLLEPSPLRVNTNGEKVGLARCARCAGVWSARMHGKSSVHVATSLQAGKRSTLQNGLDLNNDCRPGSCS